MTKQETVPDGKQTLCGFDAKTGDSPELIEELAALRERIDRLERERPRCPDCFDGGWTQGGTVCHCRRKSGNPI